jgi:hypothetical protein
MTAVAEHLAADAAPTLARAAPLELRGVRHAYREGSGWLEVLRGIDVLVVTIWDVWIDDPTHVTRSGLGV